MRKRSQGPESLTSHIPRGPGCSSRFNRWENRIGDVDPIVDVDPCALLWPGGTLDGVCVVNFVSPPIEHETRGVHRRF